MICLLFYQIFLAHFRSKKEGYMAITPSLIQNCYNRNYLSVNLNKK